MAGISLNAHRIRFAIDVSNPFASNIVNLINNQALQLPSGSSLQFELLFYFKTLQDANGGLGLIDVTQFSAINIGFCANSDPHSGVIYYQTQIAAANFTPGTTVAQFTDGTFDPTKTHVTLQISSANNVVPPAQTTYWLVIWGTSTDAAQDSVIFFAANITGKDSGIPTVPGANAGSPVKVGSKLSFVCSWDNMTRDVVLVKTPNGQPDFQISDPYNGPGQASYAMYFPAASGGDNLYHDISLILDSGVPDISINPNGHS